MSKYNKGDKIITRNPATRDPNTFKVTGYGDTHSKPSTIKRVYSHGVTTKEHGYVNNNNIIKKVTP